MNSLEFINQEIEFLEDMISMDLSLVEDDFDLQEIYKKQQRLRHLKQIKSELEAWYVVQGTIVEGEDGDGHYCYIETTYFTGEKGEKVKKGLYNDETR